MAHLQTVWTFDTDGICESLFEKVYFEEKKSASDKKAHKFCQNVKIKFTYFAGTR